MSHFVRQRKAFSGLGRALTQPYAVSALERDKQAFFARRPGKVFFDLHTSSFRELENIYWNSCAVLKKLLAFAPRGSFNCAPQRRRSKKVYEKQFRTTCHY